MGCDVRFPTGAARVLVWPARAVDQKNEILPPLEDKIIQLWLLSHEKQIPDGKK